MYKSDELALHKGKLTQYARQDPSRLAWLDCPPQRYTAPESLFISIMGQTRLAPLLLVISVVFTLVILATPAPFDEDGVVRQNATLAGSQINSIFNR